MMGKVLVTGAAGFIGSHLSERLINDGFQVIGLDSFTDYYPREDKERNLASLRNRREFSFIEGDLLKISLGEILTGVDYVFHLAAQPGVRGSWGNNFQVYLENNILATQKLLEACKDFPIKKFIFASSSSVYGDTSDLPMREESLLKPYSPYGVTKLAAENLSYLYWRNYNLPVVSLRYFTVYGPRQRPDMAFHRFIKAALKDEPLYIYGDGKQTRDFTYIDDAIEGTILALSASAGGIFNIGGGNQVSINQVFKVLEQLLGKKLKIEYKEKQLGDVTHTLAEVSRVQKLGYKPKVSLADGLQAEISWLEELI